jgi:hypothetical protein
MGRTRTDLADAGPHSSMQQSPTAALRLLRRRLSDAVFSAQRADQRTAAPNPTEATIAA